MDYPLKDLAEFTNYEGKPLGGGILIECPNCGVSGGVWFRNPVGGGPPQGSVLWDRTGDTLETMTLTPSVMMHGHFHSWVKNGMLCVDSPFACTKAS